MTRRTALSALLLTSIIGSSGALPIAPSPNTTGDCNCATDRPSQQFIEHLQRHPQSMPPWHRDCDDLRVRPSKQDVRHMPTSSTSSPTVSWDHGSCWESSKSADIMISEPNVVLTTEAAALALSAPTLGPSRAFTGEADVDLPAVLESGLTDDLDATLTLGSSPWLWLTLIALLASVGIFVSVLAVLRGRLRGHEKSRRGRLRLRGQEQRLLAHATVEEKSYHNEPTGSTL